jgi:hypothetical protein
MFYAGVCVRLRDGSAFLEARGQLEGAEFRDLSVPARKLFPPHGEVEFRGQTAAPLSIGDWVAFEVQLVSGPPGQSKYRVSESSRLLPFEDLSKLGSGEAVRRLLVEDGRVDDVAGPRMVRIGHQEMVQVQMTHDPDRRWRVSQTDGVGRLPVWMFESELCIELRSDAGTTTVVDTRKPFQQIATINWANDTEIVHRILNALQSAENAKFTSLQQFSEALLRYGEGLKGGASGQEAIDPGIAQDILRVRNLAGILKKRQDVLQSYLEVLRGDADVKALIDARISELAQSAAELERSTLLNKITAELEKETAAIRASREAEIEKSIAELETEMMNDLEKRSVARRAEIEANLTDLERQAMDTLEASVGKARAEIETAVSNLEKRRLETQDELATLEAKRRTVSFNIEELKAEEVRTLDTVERLTRIASNVASDAGVNHGQGTLESVPVPARDRSSPINDIAVGEFSDAVAKCPLLSEAGKTTLLKFTALLLAGEIPLLHGADCEDFLEVAASLISGGRLVGLIADPTIISYDDLWVRPGTRATMPLRNAVIEASGEGARTQLCVIRRADLSGARFWFPALADRMRSGDFPRRFLVCTTVEDRDSDESKELRRTWVVLDINGILAPKAAVMAPVVLRGSKSPPTQINPGPSLNDLAPAIPFLNGLTVPLRIKEGERIARIYVAAGALSADAESLARSVVSQISSTDLTHTTTVDAKVVTLGGSGHA